MQILVTVGSTQTLDSKQCTKLLCENSWALDGTPIYVYGVALNLNIVQIKPSDLRVGSLIQVKDDPEVNYRDQALTAAQAITTARAVYRTQTIEYEFQGDQKRSGFEARFFVVGPLYYPQIPMDSNNREMFFSKVTNDFRQTYAIDYIVSEVGNVLLRPFMTNGRKSMYMISMIVQNRDAALNISDRLSHFQGVNKCFCTVQQR